LLALRLALRLTTGSGPGGRIRLALTVVGIALGVVAALFALAVPQFLQAAADREAARFPVAASEQQTAVFRYAIAEDEFRDDVWTQFFLATGEGGNAPPSPPGISRFPEPGELFVSPAVNELLEAEPSARTRLPGVVAGIIGSDGLGDPDELVTYIGATPEEIPNGAPAVGFGLAGATSSPVVSSTAVRAEMLLLVGLPALAYLATCAQLSAASRLKRLAALRLLGMRRELLLRVSAYETGAMGLLGALLGIACFAGLNPLLAGSGALGFRWFAADSAIGTIGTLVLLVLVTALAARLGSAGARRVLDRPVAGRREPETSNASIIRLLPIILSFGILLPIVLTHLLMPERRSANVNLMSNLVLLGGALGVIGLLLSLRPLTARLVRTLTSESRPLPVRLAARRLEFEPSSAFRVVTGLVLLVLLAGIAPAILRDAALAAGPQASQVSLTVAGADIPTAEQRLAVANVAAEASLVVLRSETDEAALASGASTGLAPSPAAVGIDTVFATCEDFSTIVGVRLDGCVDGEAYRLSDSSGGPPESALAIGEVLAYTGTSFRLMIPEALLDVPELLARGFASETILVASAGPPSSDGWPTDTAFTLAVAATNDDIEEARSAIKKVAPSATIALQGRNAEQVEQYRVHRGVILLGLGLGLILGMLAFLLSAIDRALERRSNVAALLIVGLPSRVLRLAQVAQLIIPLIIALGLAAIVGQLIGLSYLAVSGLQRGWFAGGFATTTTMLLISLSLAVIAGLVVVGKHIRVELLRRD